MSEQMILVEGTKYDKKASKIISDSGLFNEEVSNAIIQALFKEDIHAFVHSPAWLEKYLMGIARMLVDEANGDPHRAEAFLRECPSVFDQYLMWVRENREKMGGTALDNKFNNEMSFQDVKDELKRIQDELDVKSKEELSKMDFSSSNFKIVPIDSYEQMHSLYGGKATGDGKSDAYAGGGGTAWCHTNDEDTYNSWTQDGGRFFVLQNNDWENIPFDAESNRENPRDDYGNSLMAIRTDEYGNLKNVTLRCNHVGIKSPDSADNMYKTYAELSKVAGFNVEQEIKKYVKEFTENDYFVIEGDTTITKVKDVLRRENCPKKITIPEGITTIKANAFQRCKIEHILLPETLEVIEDFAFAESSLTGIEVPDSVTKVGKYAFAECAELVTVFLPDNLKTIEEGTFHRCANFSNIYLPKNLEKIEEDAFRMCPNIKVFNEGTTKLNEIGKASFSHSGITSFEFPTLSTIDVISPFAFAYSPNLKSIFIPKSVKVIGKYAFYEDRSLVSVRGFGNSNVEVIDKGAFAGCTDLLSIKLPRTLQKVYPNAFAKCPNLEMIWTPRIEGIEEWGLPENCEIIYYDEESNKEPSEEPEVRESYQRKKELIRMKNEKDDKEVIYDSDEEVPDEGHFADDKDNLDFEDDIDEDEILVEEDDNSRAKELALAVVELFDNDSMNMTTGTYDNSENAIDNLAELKVMAQMPEKEWDKMWQDSNWSILQKFIEDHPNDAEEIFNTVADAFGFKNYADYKSYQDWVAHEEEEYVKAMQDGEDDRYYYDRTIDSPFQTEDDYYGSSSYLSSDDEENIRNSSLLKDLYGDDWYEDEPEDLEEATNAGAIANVPASHKKIDLFTEDDDEDEEEDLEETYGRRWKPSKAQAQEFAKKMDEIDEFCVKNGIKSSMSNDSYYFTIDGQNYRVSNHTVARSNAGAFDEFGNKKRDLYHPEGELDGVIYITAGKTRIMDIYNNLKAGKKLDRRGNVIG